MLPMPRSQVRLGVKTVSSAITTTVGFLVATVTAIFVIKITIIIAIDMAFSLLFLLSS